MLRGKPEMLRGRGGDTDDLGTVRDSMMKLWGLSPGSEHRDLQTHRAAPLLGTEGAAADRDSLSPGWGPAAPPQGDNAGGDRAVP